VFDLLQWTLLLIGVGHGVGRHNYYVPPDATIQAEKFLFISQPPYAWSLACAKISIAFMLIRIQRDHRVWVIFLSIMIIFSALIAITMNSFQLSLCKPLSAIWDHTNPNAKCMDPSIAQASIYVTAALTILTDVILSLAPIAFIVNIQRPLREKLALAFVMSLGIVASAASIAKTTLVRTYGIKGAIHLLPLAHCTAKLILVL
jgi:rhodopsin domain-containing protein